MKKTLSTIIAGSVLTLSVLAGIKTEELIRQKSLSEAMKSYRYEYSPEITREEVAAKYARGSWRDYAAKTGASAFFLFLSTLAIAGIKQSRRGHYSYSSEKNEKNPELDNGGDGPFGPGGSRY